jgi:HlyD family secretion protein
VRRPELLFLERLKAEAEGRMNSALAEIARSQQRIQETELNITATRVQFLDQIHDQQMRVNSEAAQIDAQFASSRDILTRLEIRSPVRGIALNPRFRTIGGVVRPGDAMLDLVPVNEPLVIEANLNPNDIDVMRVGLQADIVFTPFTNRYLPRLVGRVTRVGADANQDQRTGASFYSVRITVERTELAKLGEQNVIQSGMPVEVFIFTGARTFAEYLVQPLQRSFNRAFRED